MRVAPPVSWTHSARFEICRCFHSLSPQRSVDNWIWHFELLSSRGPHVNPTPTSPSGSATGVQRPSGRSSQRQRSKLNTASGSVGSGFSLMLVPASGPTTSRSGDPVIRLVAPRGKGAGGSSGSRLDAAGDVDRGFRAASELGVAGGQREHGRGDEDFHHPPHPTHAVSLSPTSPLLASATPYSGVRDAKTGRDLEVGEELVGVAGGDRHDRGLGVHARRVGEE